jgi:SAM-dependent methyltransferase
MACLLIIVGLNRLAFLPKSWVPARTRHSCGYAHPMPRLVDRLRMVPEVTRLAARAPRDPTEAWEGYWNRIRSTGTRGDVLWDPEIGREAEQYTGLISTFMDSTLPLVDVGCGNGRWTRRLAGGFPSALGVDVSASAVRRAEQESGERPGLSFRTLDLTRPGSGDLLHAELDDANVFVRGVFHVLRPSERRRLGSNLQDLAGTRGRVLLIETNYRGNALSYLQSLGAEPGAIPVPLQHAIAGIPQPRAFGAAERRRAFPAEAWAVLADGPTGIEAVPMGGKAVTIPGYLAMLRTR